MKTLILLLISLIFTNLLLAQNVGIGTNTPTTKLEIVYGGSGAGLLVRSTSTYSTIDIDASNGDAALRFKRNGAHRWTMRSNPSNDNFQIFDNANSVLCMNIQSGTGNVGIGTSTPTTKLEIVYGGSGAGLLVRSTSTYSTIDIDAANGDAALRFKRNGVDRWTMRNNPTNDNFQLVETGNGVLCMNIQSGTGNVGIGTSTPTTKLDVKGRTNTNQLQVGEGTVMSNIQSGSFTAGSSETSFLTTTLTFPEPFSATPKVIATPRHQSGYNVNDTYAVTIRFITTTTVTFNIKRVDIVGSWAQNLLIDWIAIQ